MPGSLDVGRDTGSLFHSFNLGAAHIIGINSEAWHGGVALESMMAWLRSDLQAAATPASRTLRPWIIVHLHRPVYSGNYGKYNDSMYPGGGGDLPVRDGVEAIFNEFGVDLVFAGHVHNQVSTNTNITLLNAVLGAVGVHIPCCQRLARTWQESRGLLQ